MGVDLLKLVNNSKIIIIQKYQLNNITMSKQPKLNKSPIESILHQSFQQPQQQTTHQQSIFTQHRGMSISNAEHPQFKISGNRNNMNINTNANVNVNANINVQNVQHKLKIIQILSHVQLQIAIDAFVAVFRKKVGNMVAYGMMKISRVQQNRNSLLYLFKSDKAIVIKKVQLIFQKIENVVKAKKLRLLGSSFIDIHMLKARNYGSDKSSSIVSPYRGYLKGGDSQRGDSEWQIAHSQGNTGSQQNMRRQNKVLKKKKQKQKNNRQQFYNRFDEMLTIHEAFLGRK